MIATEYVFVFLQQASFSSAPSSQSCVPSHNLALSIHLGVALDPPFGQTNLFSGQVMAVQLLSSVPSVQSLQPSQCQRTGIHRWFSQRNWPLWHGGKSANKKPILECTLQPICITMILFVSIFILIPWAPAGVQNILGWFY